MKSQIIALACCVAFLSVTEAKAQVSNGFGFQSQAVSSTPYYVDASRFQYNRPSSRIFSPNPNGQNVRNFTIQVPRVQPFVYYPYPYYAPYRPQRYYSPRPGVTVHVGPFIPIRRF